MKKSKSLFIAQSGVIAALYAALTWLSSLFGLSYGNIQFRFSEALTILPVFTPAAIPGLAIGCFISNISSPYGVIDMVLGTLATLLAAICTYALRKIKWGGLPILSSLMPVIFNGLIVGAEIAFFLPKGTRFSGFFLSFAQVGLGELAVCLIFGILLYKALLGNNFTGIMKK